MGLLKTIIERIQYVKEHLEDMDDVKSVSLMLEAMHGSDGLWYAKGDDKFHYKFDNMDPNHFSDKLARKISDAIFLSPKANAITLTGGVMTDKGMKQIIDALLWTQAPVKALYLTDFPNVSDASMKKLPAVIEKKGITVCKINQMPLVSGDVMDKIAAACSRNQNAGAVLAVKNSICATK